MIALVAMAVGVAVGPAPAMALPPGSAYEKVSPADKGDGEVWYRYSTIHASQDGSRVAYHMPTGTDADASVSIPTEQIGVLGADGWHTQHIMVPFADFGAAFTQTRLGYQAFSADLTKGVLLSGFVPLTPDADTTQRDLFRRDFDTGATDLLTPAPIVPLTKAALRFAGPVVAAVTPSLDHVFYEHVVQLTADAQPASAICLTYGFSCVRQAYEWFDGNVRLVGVLPDGTPAPQGAVIGGGTGTNATNQQRSDRAISRDGRRVVFTVPTTAAIGADGVSGAIYLRDAGADETIPVSASQLPDPDPADTRPATFQTAATDGSRVLFTSCERLTTDSIAVGGDGPVCDPSYTKPDLYLFDVADRKLEDLTPAAGGNVQALLGASDDAEWVYFSVEDDSDAFDIYLWHDGDVRKVTDVPLDNSAFLENWPGGTAPKGSTVSRDGHVLVYTSSTAEGGADTGGQAQIFLYDAVTDTTSCVSCLPGGGTASAPATLYSNEVAVTSARPYLPRNLDDHDRYLFFESPDALVPQDVNGTRDVYRYDIATHELALVSTGTGASDAYFGDASADGRSVFFVTRDRVIPGLDQDELADLYVARVGARPYQAPPAPRECVDDGCQGTPTAPPATSTAGSASFRGPGDVVEQLPTEHGRTFTVRRITRAQRRAWARRGRLRVAVRVSAPGKVVARATARIGRRRVVVASRASRATSRGTVRLTLRLTPRARRALRRTGHLRVALTVRCAGVRRVRTTTMNLSAPRGKRAAKAAARPQRGAAR